MTRTEFVASIKGWVNREDYSDALVLSWIRMAEERLSAELRIALMVQIDTATITENNRRVVFPPDWREADFIRATNGPPYRFKPRDDFYSMTQDSNEARYTISGNFIEFGGTIDPTDGVPIELHYYGDVPPLVEAATWLSTKYPRLYTAATLAVTEAYGFDPEKTLFWETETTRLLQNLNKEHLLSKASGSRLTATRRKGFG